MNWMPGLKWVFGAASLSLAMGSVAVAADETKVEVKTERTDTTTETNRIDRDHSEHRVTAKDVVVRRLSDLASGNVYGNDGKQIGHINGIAVDAASGRIAYAMIEFDRLADIGDKQFAIPWSAIDKKVDEKNTEKMVYAINADAERLKNARGFDRTNWPDFTDQWAQEVHTYWNVRPYWMDRDDTRVNVRTNDRDVNVEVNKDKDQDKTRIEGAPVSDDRNMERGISHSMLIKSTDLVGHRVLDQSGTDIAKLQAVMADVKTGRFVYGIVQFNKTPDLAVDHLNPVPFRMLQVMNNDRDNNENANNPNNADKNDSATKTSKVGRVLEKDAFKVVLNDVEKVKAGPKFPEREWPNMTSQWGEGVFNAYGVKPFWGADRQ